MAPPPVIDLSAVDPMRVEAMPETTGTAQAATLVFMSRGDGEIERCGCPKNPAGGLARRRTVLEGLEGTRFVFDAGDSLGKLGPVPNDRTRSKATLIASEWKDAGIDAVALGEADWRLGRDFLEGLELPVVAANLVCGTQRPLPAARIVEHDGRRVGVVGLAVGEIEGCVVTDPVQSARGAAALLTDVDMKVLLWPARGEAAHAAGLKGLPFDFVADASGRFGKDGKPFWAGTTWLVGAGIMTKALARIDVEFRPGGHGYFPASFAEDLKSDRERLDSKQAKLDGRLSPQDEGYAGQAAALRNRRTTLDARATAYGDGKVHRIALTTHRLTDDVEDDPEVAARVEAVKATFGSDRATSPAELISRKLEAPEASEYAGARACATCHAEQHTQWRKTPHARAIQTLLRTQNHFDDSCYGCHVTGAVGPYEHIVSDPHGVGGMIQVQCEACHGPSRSHVEDPEVRPVRMPGAEVCTGCHDGVRDEGRFDYQTYVPKISH